MAGDKGPLGKIVSGIIKDLDKKGRLTEEDMARAWRSAVGGRASTHSRPVSLKGARLTVNVDGSPWLYELTLKKREVLRKLGDRIGQGRIKEIRFRIGEVKGEK